ncbi:MAG: PIN domain-containing protein [Deltaproteobacteria bacterium]|nr:PIN domain-containing protein [Deltaproteobacteria bacterium]
MILCDVNIFINLYLTHNSEHKKIKSWFEEFLLSGENFAYSELVLSSFLRIISNPKMTKFAVPIDSALKFTDKIMQITHAISIRPGVKHWNIFSNYCSSLKLKANLIPDAYLAALAVEHECTWVSQDEDFKIFPNLDWKKVV